MIDDKLSQKYQRAYLFLKQRNVYDLRAYGRAFGVQRPTTKSKSVLIEEIIKIAAGITPKPTLAKKGARVRAKPISDGEIEELRKIIKAAEEPQPPIQINIPLSDKQKLCVFRGEIHVQADGTFCLSV